MDFTDNFLEYGVADDALSTDSTDPVDFRHWIGRSRSVKDCITSAPLTRLAKSFGWDDPAPSGSVPPLWHWLFAMPAIASVELGDDGHERLGLFLPPLPPSVRMWASGEIALHDSLRIGDKVSVTSEVTDVTTKQGRAGPLTFVTVSHVWNTTRGQAIIEKQVLVYKPADNAPSNGAVRQAVPAPPAPVLARYCVSDTQMFRYSALTFNSHRIHLDRGYCNALEGDPRLVVHGPLLATMLANQAGRLLGGPLSSFSFRAVSPVREGEEFQVRGECTDTLCQVWIVGPENDIRMMGRAQA